VGKWIERTHRGQPQRFPFRDDQGVPPGFRLVTDPDPVTAPVIQPEAQQHPVAEHHQHPTTTRETAPGSDVVALEDDVKVELKVGKKYKVKGWQK